MSEHSPGPWVHEYRDGSHPKNVSHSGWGTNGLWDAKGNLILGTDTGWEASYKEPTEADAKLVQAAPEMKELLKGLLAWIDKHIDEPTMDSTVLGTNLVLKAEMLLRDLQ